MKSCDSSGDTWKSFDYDSKIGDDSTTIKYDKVATVSIEDQDVDLFSRDSAQAPDHVKGEQYEARVKMFTLPRLKERGGKTDMFSLVVTIDFDSEATEATQDVVENIVSTMSIPACVWDELLIREETMREMDLNGDGKIKTQEEYQAELKAKLDESMAKAQKDAKDKDN